MQIEVTNHYNYKLTSDSYPDNTEHYDLVLKTVRGCIAGTHATLEFAVDGNCVIIPAEIVKQSVVTVINETEREDIGCN